MLASKKLRLEKEHAQNKRSIEALQDSIKKLKQRNFHIRKELEGDGK